MNYLKENNKLSVSTLAQVEGTWILGMGANNKKRREKQEDFPPPLSMVHISCLLKKKKNTLSSHHLENETKLKKQMFGVRLERKICTAAK